MPGNDHWQKLVDDKSGVPYWYNSQTGDTQWENPSGADDDDSDLAQELEEELVRSSARRSSLRWSQIEEIKSEFADPEQESRLHEEDERELQEAEARARKAELEVESLKRRKRTAERRLSTFSNPSGSGQPQASSSDSKPADDSNKPVRVGSSSSNNERPVASPSRSAPKQTTACSSSWWKWGAAVAVGAIAVAGLWKYKGADLFAGDSSSKK